jgi:hypothetical protein
LAIAAGQRATQRALVKADTLLNSQDEDVAESRHALKTTMSMRTVSVDFTGMGPLAKTILEQVALRERIRLIPR